MKKLFALLLILCLSCSTNSLEWDGMEQIYVELDRPGYYHWTDASDSSKTYEEFKVEEGPYRLRISEKLIEVDTGKPIKEAQHLRGKYGTDRVVLELTSPSSFKVKITDPDPYAEVFRIIY